MTWTESFIVAAAIVAISIMGTCVIVVLACLSLLYPTIGLAVTFIFMVAAIGVILKLVTAK